MLWAVVHLKKLLLTVKPHVQPRLISNHFPYEMTTHPIKQQKFYPSKPYTGNCWNLA